MPKPKYVADIKTKPCGCAALVTTDGKVLAETKCVAHGGKERSADKGKGGNGNGNR